MHARREGEVLGIVEPKVIFLLVPRPRNSPFSKSTPSSGSSMQAAATRLPLAMIFSEALTMAEAPTAPEREP
jgi:hypothetical protein